MAENLKTTAKSSGQEKNNGDFSDDEEAVISQSDFVQALNDDINTQETAIAILGAADDKICTYPEGYLSRQALFACRTCKLSTNGKHPLLCYACSVNCHNNHTLVELYTKRNTRCDCPTHSCKIQNLVVGGNVRNNYNQNSQKETYCSCQARYPDPDDQIVDNMYQCVVCEDWYHSRHIFGESIVDIDLETREVYFKDEDPAQDLFEKLNQPTSEIICKSCSDKFAFLDDSSHVCRGKGSVRGKSLVIDNSRRTEWHSCDSCQALLNKHNLDYLTDIKDTVYYFESQQKQAADNQIEQFMQERVPDRSAQLTLASGIADLKKDLTEFLESRKRKVADFSGEGSSSGGSSSGASGLSAGVEVISSKSESKADAGHSRGLNSNSAANSNVITDKDIKQFFEQLNEKRRRLMDGSGASQ